VYNVVFGTWFPLILFLPLGIFLTFKAARDSALFDLTSYTDPVKKYLKTSEKQNMKILQLCNKAPYPANDGSSIAICTLAEGIADNNIELHLLPINTKKHFKPEKIYLMLLR